MKSQTVLITGATSGIGFYTALALALKGAQIIVTGRDERRGHAAANALRRRAGHDSIYFIAVNHSIVGENQALAERVSRQFGRLDVLINNVGAFYNDRWETTDGYEATLALNFVGPIALTTALLPALRQSAPARIVSVNSAGHAMWKGDPFADLHSRHAYLGFDAHARSKLLNLMWHLALARRLEGSEVAVNAANPGMAWTSQTQGIQARSMPAAQRLFWPLFRLIQQRGAPVEAARSIIYLASAPEVAHVNGQYYESNARPATPVAAAREEALQEKTWHTAAEMVAQAATATASAPADGLRV